MRKVLIAVVFACIMALSVSMLAACSNSQSKSNSVVSQTTTTKEPKEPIHKDFFSITLPNGINETTTPYVFANNQNTISFFVNVYNTSADEILGMELVDSNFSKGDNISAGGLSYKTAVSKETQQAYYVAKWEDGCVEVGVNGNIEDTELIKEFLNGLTFDENAYAKWQAAPKEEVPQSPEQPVSEQSSQNQNQNQNQNQS